MVHDLSYRHPGISCEHQVRSQDDDQDGARLADKTLEGIVAETCLTDLHLVAVEACLELCLPVHLDLLAVEGLDDIHALEDIHDAPAAFLVEASHVPP